MIYTSTGRFIDPFNLRAEDISITDIAHALAYTCRFGGHTSRFYSVAEHSARLAAMAFWPTEQVRDIIRAAAVEVGELAEGDFVPTGAHNPLARWLLLHDATEAYLTDVPAPFKAMPAFAEYRALESRMQGRIMAHFNVGPLPPWLLAAGHRLDRAMLAPEASQLLPLDARLHSWPRPRLKIIEELGWTPERAKAIFLAHFTELFPE